MLPWFARDRPPLFLAPMAGYSDVAFRGLCRAQGADVVVTEFVRAEALLSGAFRVWDMVDFSPEQRPIGVQVFGADPTLMAEAARQVASRLAPDFVDLNFGCPADPVTDGGAGSSCLLDLPRMEAIARAVVEAVSPLPVTAKMRIGWDERQVVAPEAARRLEAAGARAITVHGRTKAQGYSGRADWSVIAEVARAVSVPVVGNGDIASAEDVRRHRDSGVRGFMVGRAAIGYPWLFREIRAALDGLPVPPPPSLEERWEVILGYARALLARHPWGKEPGSIAGLRARLKAMTKDFPGGRPLRAAIERCPDFPALERIAAEHVTTFGGTERGCTSPSTHVS